MSTNTLEVQDLRTHFFTRSGVVRAVDGVSFEVKPGEVLGLVDAPGRIVGGRILFEGTDLVALPEEEMRHPYTRRR